MFLMFSGLLGNISVYWQLRSIGPDSDVPFRESSGVVEMDSGEERGFITFNLIDDDIPSEARRWGLALEF